MSVTQDTAEAVPHVDLDVERAVLGSCLLSWSAAARDVTQAVAPEDFYRAGHAAIWRAIRAVDAAGGSPDPVSVCAWLRAHEALAAAGGGVYVALLIDGLPRQTAASIGWHVAQLQGLARGRRIMAEAQRLQAMAREADAVADGAIADQVGVLAGLLEGGPHAGRVLDAAAQIAALHADASRDASQAVPLGLPGIDSIIAGVRPGEVLGLMARPGIGKTLVLSQAMTQLAEHGRPVLGFSLEMPAAQIVARCVGMHYHLRPKAVYDGAREGRFSGWATTMHALRIDGTPGLSVADMDRIVAREPVPPQAVLIDHLGLVGGDRKLSTYDRTSMQAREIKELAKRRNVAVVLAIQVSREAGGHHGEKRLGLGSARDSGVVEEAMDYLVGVRRFDRVPTLPADERTRIKDILFASVAKNRHGDVPDREWAYYIAPDGLRLVEQDECAPPTITDDASFGGRRR